MFLDTMSLITPQDIEFRISNELGNLPLFNPDLQDDPPEGLSR